MARGIGFLTCVILALVAIAEIGSAKVGKFYLGYHHLKDIICVDGNGQVCSQLIFRFLNPASSQVFFSTAEVKRNSHSTLKVKGYSLGLTWNTRDGCICNRTVVIFMSMYANYVMYIMYVFCG